MNDFPLKSFLLTLKAKGIQITFRDYERISLAISTGEKWTLPRLKNTLIALLARDENQADIIVQNFGKEFELAVDENAEFSEINLQLALADLKLLAEQTKPHPLKPRIEKIKRIYQQPVSRSNWLKWSFGGFTIVLVGFLSYLFWPVSPQPKIQVTPSPVNFDPLVRGKEDTKEVIVKNVGDAVLYVKKTRIRGLDYGDFHHLSGDSSFTLLPKDSISISIQFKPLKVGLRSTYLEIFSNTTDSLYLLLISGTCFSGTARTVVEPPKPRFRKYKNIPRVAQTEYKPLEKSNAWKLIALIALILFIFSVAHGIYLLRSHKIFEDKPPVWDPEGPHHFSMSSIGGKPAPWLDEVCLEELADSMGYFQSEAASKELNVPASIEATGRKGGIPDLEFYKRKQIRSLLILEDQFAEAKAWNPVAGELAAGMSKRGIPVTYGQFIRTPETFTTPDGIRHHLEDFEDQRRGLVLMIFTDGKGIDRRSGTFLFEALARWPMVAWMELRETTFWDENTALPVQFEIPVYPATSEGLKLAMSRFLTERSEPNDFAYQVLQQPVLPNPAETTLESYTEDLLADALLWASDCAMMPIAFSLGLADKIRRKFHPDLLPGRIERILALPGTCQNVNGIHFSKEILRVLRGVFLARRSDADQQKVLEFIKLQIEAAEPGLPENGKENLARLGWKALLERIDFELDPKNDLKRLAGLANTPMQVFIKRSFEHFGFQDQKDKIPLRLKPVQKKTQQRLAKFNKSLLTLTPYSFPIGFWQLIFLFILIVSSFIPIIFDFNDLYIMLMPKPNFQIKSLSNVGWRIVSQHLSSAEYSFFDEGFLDSFLEKTLLEKQRFNLSFYSSGIKTFNEFTVPNDVLLQPLIAEKDTLVECQQNFPKIGLTAYRCPPEGDTENLSSWRETLGNRAPPHRLLSVGMVIHERFSNLAGLNALIASNLNQFISKLFQTGSIDVVYQITPDSSGQWGLKEAFKQIETDLGPCIPRSQLVWWSNGLGADDSTHLDFLKKFGRSLALNPNPSNWMNQLNSLLAPDEDQVITENDIRETINSVTVSGDSAPIVLARPLTRFATLTVETNIIRARLMFNNLTTKENLPGSPGKAFQLKPGNWEVVVEAVGYFTAKDTVSLQAGSTERIVLNLQFESQRFGVIAFSAANR